MSDEHPVVELWPWEARAGVPRRTVWVPVDGVPTALAIRIPAGVRNRALLRLPGERHLRVRITLRPLVIRVLTGLVLFAGLLTVMVMNRFLLGVVLLAAGWALVEFCRSRRDRTTGFRHQLCVFGVLYLIPITFAVALHVVLGVVVAVWAEALPNDRLLALQRTFEAVSSYFSENLKLNEAAMLGLLVLIYLLSVLIANVRASKAMHRAANFYGRFSGPVAAGLATLAAFTFFGTQTGVYAQYTELRFKQNGEKYTALMGKVEQELATRVASDLAEKITQSLPSDYSGVLRPVVVLPIPGGGTRTGPVPPARAPMPATVTAAEVTAKQDTFRSAAKTTLQDVNVAGEKKIVLQVEKLVTEALTNAAKKAMAQVPLLEPVMQAFVEAVDKHLQSGVLDAAYDRVRDAVWRNPGDVDAILRESAGLVSKVDTSALPSVGGETAARLIRKATINDLVANLKVEATAENARRTLAGMSNLTRDEMERVAEVFEDETNSKYIRENAARAISASTSAHRTQDILDRAIRVCQCHTK